MDRHRTFSDAIRAAGLEPPDFIEPGKIHRFPGAGKRGGNTAGWCKLFPDGRSGCFGDWASGLSGIWRTDQSAAFTKAERAQFVRLANEAREEAERQQEREQAVAARRAQAIWIAAPRATDAHRYLIRKKITRHGARLYKTALVLPVTNFQGELTSLQFIDAAGGKRLLAGGRKRGCFIPVAGDPARAERIIICEGWATGCTLAEDEPDSAVIAAIDAGNLGLVAVSARCFWPVTEIVIAGDDDRRTAGNPGATKARAAADAADAALALPRWPAGAPETLTDFNDLDTWIKGGKQ